MPKDIRQPRLLRCSANMSASVTAAYKIAAVDETGPREHLCNACVLLFHQPFTEFNHMDSPPERLVSW